MKEGSVHDRIAALEMELRQLMAAQSEVDQLTHQIADTQRLITKVESATGFNVRPIASYSSREEDVFEVSLEAGGDLSDALLAFLKQKRSDLISRLEEAEQKALAIKDVDGGKINS